MHCMLVTFGVGERLHLLSAGFVAVDLGIIIQMYFSPTNVYLAAYSESRKGASCRRTTPTRRRCGQYVISIRHYAQKGRQSAQG